MNGVHDCGGMQCYGPLQHTAAEPPFPERWEARVLALNVASWYVRNADLPTFRSDIEALPAADYLRISYWEIWYTALLNRLVANHWLTRREVEVGHSDGTTLQGAQAISAPEAVAELFKPRTQSRKDPQVARFRVGSRVRAKNMNPTGHTRLPRYVRGKGGVVTAYRGIYDFPDTDEYNLGANPTAVYSVRFAGRELWGNDAPANDVIYVDLWERYLEPT